MESGNLTVPTAHLFTRDEYYRMAEAGLFREERVELIEGEIVCTSPQNSPHASALYRVAHALERLSGATTCIRGQLPIVLNDWSEPEPDVAVCLPDPYDYSRAHPQPDQILLLIEVADASLAYDRGRRAALYATSNIPEVWIIDLTNRQVEILTAPDMNASEYRQRHAVRLGARLSLPDGKTIAVSDILPRL